MRKSEPSVQVRENLYNKPAKIYCTLKMKVENETIFSNGGKHGTESYKYIYKYSAHIY